MKQIKKWLKKHFGKDSEFFQGSRERYSKGGVVPRQTVLNRDEDKYFLVRFDNDNNISSVDVNDLSPMELAYIQYFLDIEKEKEIDRIKIDRETRNGNRS